jgi:hypothetical protein
MSQRIWQPSGWRIRVGLLALLLLGSLSGCAELQYKAGELYGWNCRPQALTTDGRCVASR